MTKLKKKIISFFKRCVKEMLFLPYMRFPNWNILYIAVKIKVVIFLNIYSLLFPVALIFVFVIERSQ